MTRTSNPEPRIAPQCPVCASASVRSLPFGYMFNGRWLGGCECRTCGIIFLHPQPTADELVQMYSKEYFEGDFRCGHAGSYFDESTHDALADRSLIAKIKRLKPEGSFLEIGCAGGAFLHAARQAGYRVTGVEFSDAAAQLARERFHLDVFTGDVRDAQFSSNTFDVVFMGDVLEHLTEPVATCSEVYRVLAPGGIFVIECPMQTNTLFSRLGFAVYALLRKRAIVNLPPYHVFEYRRSSMTSLLKRCGFTIVCAREGIIPPHKIALRGTGVQNLGKKLFQYPNALLTRLFGVFGDRIEMIAQKPSGVTSA